MKKLLKFLFLYLPHAFLFFIVGMVVTNLMRGGPQVEGSDQPMLHAAPVAYDDVPADHWAADAIQWVSQYDIMKGSTDNPPHFDPGGPVNRAGLATVAQRVYQLMNTRMRKVEQLAAAIEDVKHYMVILSGEHVSPPVQTKASGSALLILSTEGLWYDIRLQNTTGTVVSAVIETGTGASQQLLALTVSDAGGAGVIKPVANSVREALLSGKTSLMIRTAGYPDGELNGSIDALGKQAAPASHTVTSSAGLRISSVSSAPASAAGSSKK